MRGAFFLACYFILKSLSALAIPSGTGADVLPKGVWNVSLQSGYVTDLSNHYDSTGSLQSIGRLNQAFVGDKLGKYSTDLQQLTKYLNTIYPNNSYVSQLSLGGLQFEANASVIYYAPVLAYGLTPKLTVGIGVPIATIHANVHAYQVGSNTAAQVCNQIAQGNLGALNSNLADGCTKLPNINLVQTFDDALTSRGYIIPTSKDQTVLGDVELAAYYQYFKNNRWILTEQTTINLPTGPEDDPSDFLDIPVFHQIWVRENLVQDFRLTPKWTLEGQVGYTLKVPDHIDKRVPVDESDLLPAADRQERVSRDLGDIINLGGSTNYWLTNIWNIGTGFEYDHKGQDRYSGSRGYDYSLLSRNTESEWTTVFADVTFSTIDSFMAHEFGVPFQISYMYSDIVSGRNVDEQTAHEITLRMFF